MSSQAITKRPQNRFRRALVFLAVVWSIGGGFLLLQGLFVHLSDFSLGHLVPAEIGLPKQSPVAAAHCQEVLKNSPVHRGPEHGNRYRAWNLGFQFGFVDEMVNGAARSPAEVANMLANMRSVAGELGVTEVILPKGHTAYAVRDFTVSLEEDPQCIAATLAMRHSPQHASLYKFGAALGLAAVYRAMIPNGGAILEPEIEAYGRAAGVPPEFWQPFLQNRITVQPPAANPAAAVQTLVGRLDAYIKTLD